jgi:hypothetical protein
MRVWPVAAMIICAVHSATWAACFNPFGCDPKSLDECMDRAAAMPTELGVRTAKRQCESKFAQELQRRWDIEASASQERAERIAKAWDGLVWGRDAPISLYEKALGPPFLVLGPKSCTKHSQLPAPPSSGCYAYLWEDKRSGRVEMFFKAEAQNTPGRPVRAKWPDSVPD